ncbi:MAG: non-heme iron oxygenase ferredoxin subunit [Thermomicrobiales bacterium]|nr:non-heme iron oxygenase ferredoxin subunit [Thermomicrobiales bacterium]
MPQFITVARAEEIPVGTPKQVFVEDQPIAICNVDGEFFAISDICTHDAYYLSYGRLDGDEIECPMHRAVFNVRTGEVEIPPAEKSLRTFACRVVDGEVQIEV